MYLIYVDEAGNTGRNLNDPQQPYHVVLALPVREDQWHDVEREMGLIVDRHIPEPDRATFEFHAHDLHQGTGYFRGWQRAVRVTIAHELLGLLERFALPVIFGAVDKRAHARRYISPVHPHILAFMLAAERCERYLAGLDGVQLGMFIADENASVEPDVRASLRNYRHKGIPLGMLQERLDHIIEDIHFQSSQVSCFLQLVDICAYYAKRHLVCVGRGIAEPMYQLIAPQVWDHRVLPA